MRARSTCCAENVHNFVCVWPTRSTHQCRNIMQQCFKMLHRNVASVRPGLYADYARRDYSTNHIIVRRRYCRCCRWHHSNSLIVFKVGQHGSKESRSRHYKPRNLINVNTKRFWSKKKNNFLYTFLQTSDLDLCPVWRLEIVIQHLCAIGMSKVKSDSKDRSVVCSNVNESLFLDAWQVV